MSKVAKQIMGESCSDPDESWRDAIKSAVCRHRDISEAHESQMAKQIVGETVVTSDRTLNHILGQAEQIIQRRDVAPLDRVETLYAYLSKARRELLGKVDK